MQDKKLITNLSLLVIGDANAGRGLARSSERFTLYPKNHNLQDPERRLRRLFYFLDFIYCNAVPAVAAPPVEKRAVATGLASRLGREEGVGDTEPGLEVAADLGHITVNMPSARVAETSDS